MTNYLRIGLIAHALIFAGMAHEAAAQKAIYTGGAQGAYHSLFCPPLTPALQNAYFAGYNCTTSAGTVENIAKVLAAPKTIGFVQLDVFALESQKRTAEIAKLTIIRQLACEGLWMVTKNPKFTSFGDILGLARRVPFILPPENSGATATFRFLQSIDPALAEASNITFARDTTEMLNRVAAGQGGEVGFFVQFADPENGNIKLIMDKGLKVIPVVSKAIVDAKVQDQPLYQVQEFALTASGWFIKGNTATTACTPVAIVTGAPESFTVPGDKKDQKDMVDAVKGIAEADLLPKESRIAAIIKNAKRISGRALDEMVAAVDLAKQKVSQ